MTSADSLENARVVQQMQQLLDQRSLPARLVDTLPAGELRRVLAKVFPDASAAVLNDYVECITRENVGGGFGQMGINKQLAEISAMRQLQDKLARKGPHVRLMESFQPAELLQLLSKVLPEVDAEVREIFARVILRGLEGSSQIEFGLIDAQQLRSKSEAAFMEIDTNASGAIDPWELSTLVQQLFPTVGYEVQKNHFDKIMKDCDKNRDDIIDLDEFLDCDFLMVLADEGQQELYPRAASIASPPPGARAPVINSANTAQTLPFKPQPPARGPSPAAASYGVARPRSAAAPTPSGRASVATPHIGVRADRRPGLSRPASAVTPAGGSLASFASSSSATSNINPVIDRLKYTMEDYTRWTCAQVRQFVVELSEGCSLLQKDLQKNLYAFNEVDGAQLESLTFDDLATLGVSYKCFHLFDDALKKLRDVGALNAERRKRARQLLAAFLSSDVDGSGTIEPEEINTVVKATFPELSEAIIGSFFRVLLRECDSTGSGVIDLTALMNSDHDAIMMKVMAEGEKAELVEKIFNELDVDQSGELDHDELSQLINLAFPEAGPTTRRKYFNQILQEVDVDNSGKVSLEEVLQSELVLLMTELPKIGDENLSASGTPPPASLTPTGPSPGASPRPPSSMDVRSSSRNNGHKSVEQRCVMTSPRRQEPVSRTMQVPHVTRLARDNFRPRGSHGQALIDKAEQLLELNPEAHWMEASEYFEDGAQMFEEGYQWEAAGQAWERASDCQERMSQPLESASRQHRAGLCYQSVSPVDAVQCFKEAAETYLREGHQRSAATEYRHIAETYEYADDAENAIDWYGIAASMYPKRELLCISRCMQRQVVLFASLGLWEDAMTKAREVVEQVVDDQSRSSPVLPTDIARLYQLGILLIQLSLIHTSSGVARLAGLEKVERALKRYLEVESTPKDRKFATDIVTCVKRDDGAAVLRAIVTEFTEGRALDEWIKGLLSSVRDNVVLWQKHSNDAVEAAVRESNNRTVVIF